jgi:two-component system sensor histidine kinase/response regulator
MTQHDLPSAGTGTTGSGMPCSIPEPRTVTILVVDDVPANIKTLVALLERDYQLRIATSGQAALDIARSKPVDLILLDVVMAGLDGFEVCRQLKADPQTAPIPVIFLSALSETVDKATGFQLGAVDYITKPVQADDVLARVRVHVALFMAQRQLQEQNRQLTIEIAERKRIENVLRLHEQVLLHMDEGVALVRTIDSALVYVNLKFEHMFGYQTQELIGQPIHVLDAPENHSAVDTMLEEVLYALMLKDVWHRDWFTVKKNGDGFWCHVIVSKFHHPVHGPVLIFIHQDITDYKNLLTSLNETLKAAEAANRAKSEFLSNMSHEIRTPLNAIIGMTDIILNTSLSREEERNNLYIVHSSSLALLDLINSILDLSKIEAGHLVFESIPFDLLGQLETVCESMAIKAHQKGLNLYCDMDPDLPVTMIGDPLRLKQVLMNLLNNAIKFTERGEVVLRVTRAAPLPDMPALSIRLQFAVVDTGIGIPPEQHALVFENFVQADGSTSRKYGGTGLGLTICKHLVQRMGGQISLLSEVGSGSTFQFAATFGVAPQPRQDRGDTPFIEERGSAPPCVSPDGALNGMRILLGDRHDTGRFILHDILQIFGATVTPVADITKMLDALQQAASEQTPFDVVVMDEGLLEMEIMHHELNSPHPGCRGEALILLSSHVALEQLSIPGFLPHAVSLKKPVRKFRLLKKLRQITGASPGESSIAATTRIPAETQAAGQTVPLHILIVEDVPANQQLASIILRNAGHTIMIANHGGEALLLLRQSRFDLILMDLQMPEMDGFEATRRIRAGATDGILTPNIPIIAVTAKALRDEKQRCLDLGMNGFLLKPYLAHQLRDVISPYTRRRATSPAPPPRNAPVLDPVELDADTLAQQKSLFVEAAPQQMEKIGSAITRKNAGQAMREAAYLKELATTIGASRIRSQLIRFMGHAEMEDWEDALQIHDKLTGYVNDLVTMLTQPDPEATGP